MRALPVCVALGVLHACLVSSPAMARCPNGDPADSACEPLASMLMPSLETIAYFPKGRSAPYLGGGVDLVLFAWSTNNDAFGPSQGALRMGASYAAGPGDRRMMLYRLESTVSFERNASRRFLIPYFGTALGGLWESELGTRPFVEGELGLFLLYTRGFVLDAQGALVLPFTAVETLLGPKAQLVASFALW